LFFLGSTTLLSGMTGISLHMQWPLTSQSHGSVSQREQLDFLLRTKLQARHWSNISYIGSRLCMSRSDYVCTIPPALNT
jgi:hypothetical protein